MSLHSMSPIYSIHMARMHVYAGMLVCTSACVREDENIVAASSTHTHIDCRERAPLAHLRQRVTQATTNTGALMSEFLLTGEMPHELCTVVHMFLLCWSHSLHTAYCYYVAYIIPFGVNVFDTLDGARTHARSMYHKSVCVCV